MTNPGEIRQTNNYSYTNTENCDESKAEKACILLLVITKTFLNLDSLWSLRAFLHHQRILTWPWLILKSEFGLIVSQA